MKTVRTLRVFLPVSAIFALTLLGAGCAPKPLTPDQQIFQQARQACTEDADAMIGPQYASNPMVWDNYFEWCMGNKGYSQEQLRDIWF